MNFNVILEILQKNKALFVALYILLLVALVLVIWWPKTIKVSDLAKYNAIEMEQIYQSTAQKYINNLTAKFRLFGQQSIADLLDSKLTYHYNKTRSQLVADLEADGYFDSNMYMTCSNIIELEDEIIFVTKLHSGNNYRTLNIIESAPNKYRLALDTSYKYAQSYGVYSSNNAVLTVESVYQDMNYIEYNVQIKNASTSDITISLDRTSDIYILMQDGTTHGLSNVESEVEDFRLTEGSTFSKKLIFNVPLTAQRNISSIVFSSVGIDGKAGVLQYKISEDGE